MPHREENEAKSRAAAVSLADENGVREVVAETVLALWDAVNNLTRLRPTRRERYRVTIFGSARVPRDSWVYTEVKRLARALTDLGCDIVSGGGPGLMQAANEGACEAGSKERSLGIRVDLPFEQEANPFVEEVFEHRTFFTRLHQFVLMSDAFVVVPGGVGTVLETLMIWQLLQVKHLERTPLILIGAMWADLRDWARRHMTELHPELPLAKPEDMEIPICLKSADEAIGVIRERHAEWLREQGR